MPQTIESIELKNFQRHEHLVLELSPGLTAIIGAGDRGKSSVVRSTGHVLVGDPNSDDLRRHHYEDGEKVQSKQTSVSIKFDSGTVVERIRSKTINRYVITLDDQKPLELNRFGRSIPQDVLDATGMEPLTIGDQTIFPFIQRQHDPYFLLSGMTGPSRWKAISSLAGTEAADKVVQGLNSDIGELGKAINVIDKQLVEDGEALAAEQTALEALETLFTVVDQLRTQVEDLSARHTDVKDLENQWKTNVDQMDSTERELDVYGKRSTRLQKATEGIEDSEGRRKVLDSLVDNLERTNAALSTLEPELQAAKTLTNIEVPDLTDMQALANLIRDGVELNAQRKTFKVTWTQAQAVLNIEPPDIESYHQLRSAVNAAAQWTKDRSACVSSLKAEKQKASGLQNEFESLLIEVGQCPLCGLDQTGQIRSSCS